MHCNRGAVGSTNQHIRAALSTSKPWSRAGARHAAGSPSILKQVVPLASTRSSLYSTASTKHAVSRLAQNRNCQQQLHVDSEPPSLGPPLNLCVSAHTRLAPNTLKWLIVPLQEACTRGLSQQPDHLLQSRVEDQIRRVARFQQTDLYCRMYLLMLSRTLCL
jgi:hypothetical protein